MDNAKDRQRNVNLYTRYKMISWDLLFYYAIIFLFFTETKGISAADVLLAEALYPIFKIVFLIPATILIESLGKRNSLIIGNIFLFFSILTYIAANNFLAIVIGEFLSAVGFIIKGVCESNILYDSLDKDEKRGSRFAKIEGKGMSYFYYAEAISSALSGFLFAVNGYIPMFLCLGTIAVSIYFSIKFRNIDEPKEEKKVNVKRVLKEGKDILKAFKLFNRSPRLKNLIFFGAIVSGLFMSITMLRSSIMQEIGIPSEYFGIIFAIMQLLAGLAAKNENRFHKKFRNKTLASLSLPLVFSCIIIGLLCCANLGYSFDVVVVISMLLIQYVVKGPFYPLIKQYLNNFTTFSVRTKIASCFNLLENVFRFVITLAASALLRVTDTANTFLIIGCVMGLIVVLMLDNMRKKVGLKPEQYSKRDIEIMELK